MEVFEKNSKHIPRKISKVILIEVSEGTCGNKSKKYWEKFPKKYLKGYLKEALDKFLKASLEDLLKKPLKKFLMETLVDYYKTDLLA